MQLQDKPIPVHQNPVYVAVLTGFSQEYSPDSLSNTLLSQGCILEGAPSSGTLDRMFISRPGGLRRLQLLGSISRVNWCDHILLMTSLNISQLFLA